MTILKSTVFEKIFRKFDVENELCIQEPVGWYREFHWIDTPSMFIHFLQRNCRNFKCCTESESSIDIQFRHENEKQFIENSQDTLDNCVNIILRDYGPQDDAEKLITFTRLWRGFANLTGRCVSCNYNLEQEDEITCYLCLSDHIILKEAIHFDGFWNNIGNFTFISESLPTLTTRNILMESGPNLDYMTCILGCKTVGGIPSCPFAVSYKEVNEGKCTTTWVSMTNPRYYFLSMKFLRCASRDSKVVLPLSRLLSLHCDTDA